MAEKNPSAILEHVEQVQAMIDAEEEDFESGRASVTREKEKEIEIESRKRSREKLEEAKEW